MPPDTTWPRLLHRVLAASWDALLMCYGAIFLLVVGDALGLRSPEAKLLLILAPFLVLDPLLIWLTGSSPGHRLYNLRVLRQDGGRPGLPALLLRFPIKFLLGGLSWLPALVSRRHQALHDLIVGTVVVHRDPARVQPRDVWAEYRPEAGYAYPGGWRRSLVIVAYMVLATVVVEGIGSPLLGPACWDEGRCTPLGALGLLFANLNYFLLLGFIVVRGWGGRLYGARRQPLV